MPILLAIAWHGIANSMGMVDLQADQIASAGLDRYYRWTGTTGGPVLPVDRYYQWTGTTGTTG
jgi:hypothetical protein